MVLRMSSILNTRKEIQSRKVSLFNQAREIIYLTKRLFLQVTRRPSGFISGLLQPLLWLLLFGGLFHNIPLNLFSKSSSYGPFLSCGIIVFTSFTGSLNAGLPLMFDREFGFLNRLLASPIISRYSIIIGTTFFIVCITMVQNLTIILCSFNFFQFYIDYNGVSLILAVLLLITCSISSLSLSLAFILPGHIEFIALILIINLPMLFASTALAPIYFMPYWLQIIAKFNLLTYGIEAIRLIVFNYTKNNETYVIQLLGYDSSSLHDTIILLTTITCMSFFAAKRIVSRKIK